jgi:hypothetical protein
MHSDDHQCHNMEFDSSLDVLWYARVWACSYRRDCVRYLLSSAALFLSSSLLAGSPRPSAMTGPCLERSVALEGKRERLMTYRVGTVVLSSGLAAAGGAVLDIVHGVGRCV